MIKTFMCNNSFRESENQIGCNSILVTLLANAKIINLNQDKICNC